MRLLLDKTIPSFLNKLKNTELPLAKIEIPTFFLHGIEGGGSRRELVIIRSRTGVLSDRT